MPLVLNPIQSETGMVPVNSDKVTEGTRRVELRGLLPTAQERLHRTLAFELRE